MGLDVDLDFAGPTIHGAAVAGYEGWLAGYQMTIDSAKSRMTHSNFAVGYQTGDFQLHTNVYVFKMSKYTKSTRLRLQQPLVKMIVFFLSHIEMMVQSLVAPFIRR